MGQRPIRAARLLAVLACLVMAAIGLRGLGSLHLALTPPIVSVDAARWLSAELFLIAVVLVILARKRLLRRRRQAEQLDDFGVPPSADRWRAVLALLLLLPLLAVAALGVWGAVSAPAPQPGDDLSSTSDGHSTGQFLRGVLPGVTVAVAAAAAIVILVALATVYARRTRRIPAVRPAGPDAAQRWMAALQAAADAIRAAANDEPRAAVIACYAAMERSLTETAAAPAAADTPSQVLSRARLEGLLRGPAAGRLTELFAEARYSRHPFTDLHRQRAAAALDAVLAELSARHGTGVGPLGARA
jgi:Domain of unknown function (DUF4129)